jgi:hypothetical protein
MDLPEHWKTDESETPLKAVQMEGLVSSPCSLAECDPGQYVAVMPHFSETARIRCTVHVIEEFQGSRSWKEVTLNQGTLKDKYLTRRQLRGAKFYRENVQDDSRDLSR